MRPGSGSSSSTSTRGGRTTALPIQTARSRWTSGTSNGGLPWTAPGHRQSCATRSSAARPRGRRRMLSMSSTRTRGPARTSSSSPRAESTAGDVVRDRGGIGYSESAVCRRGARIPRHGCPGLGVKRYTLHSGKSAFTSHLRIGETTISDANLKSCSSGATGAITGSERSFPAVEYVDTTRAAG